MLEAFVVVVVIVVCDEWEAAGHREAVFGIINRRRRRRRRLRSSTRDLSIKAEQVQRESFDKHQTNDQKNQRKDYRKKEQSLIARRIECSKKICHLSHIEIAMLFSIAISFHFDRRIEGLIDYLQAASWA